MKISVVLILMIGSLALSACADGNGFPKSKASTVKTGDQIVHTPVVGLTTVTRKTDADNPY